MASGFPPVPVYPKGYDSDSTLFLVYNTSETITTADNAPWSEEINVKAVHADAHEIWANNGFANIEGELFYYDSVELDSNGKVFKLKRCARNLGGTHTKFTPLGSEVRGFVIAEHHNQLVDAILNTEEFIGYQFNLDCATLDWRIRNLQAIPVIFDDYTCPDIILDILVLSQDPAQGTVISYNLTINGSYNSFRLDFGDGSFTTSATNGQHVYAPNATMDPVVTISNPKCSIVQSPIQRTVATEPPALTTIQTFEITIPVIPQLPPIIFPNITPPSNAFNIPPIVFPCLDIGPIGPIDIPSVIIIDPPIVIPSIITITPITIPSIITITPITIPSIITITPITIPSIITITPIMIPDIHITPITITPVNIPTKITITPVNIPTKITITPVNIPTKITITPVNIPTKITITPVNIPTKITITPVNIPTKITITPVNIPTLITITPVNIPTLITITPVNIPTLITITPVNIPTKITITPVSIPTLITITPVSIPTLITITPVSIPTLITITPVSIPTLITITPVSIPTLITITPVDIPTLITITPVDIPTLITITPVDIPTLITITPVDIPTLITITPVDIPTLISFGPAPSINVTWDTPPTVTCTVTVNCGSSSTPSTAMMGGGLLSDFQDGFSPIDGTVQVQDLGIPTEIQLIVPEIPDIRVIHDIPAMIEVVAPKIPDIKITGWDQIPKAIEVVVQSDFPKSIELIGASEVPKTIFVDAANVPTIIKLEIPDNFPKTIVLDASGIPDKIQVVGIPQSIELVGPSEIKLKLPDEPIEMIYKGAPIEMKITLDTSKLTGEDATANCVAIVPCKPN